MELTPKIIKEMEEEANNRFNAKKAEGVACEQRIAKEQGILSEISSELVRIQGEFRTIQNLRKQAEGSTLPTKKK